MCTEPGPGKQRIPLLGWLARGTAAAGTFPALRFPTICAFLALAACGGDAPKAAPAGAAPAPAEALVNPDPNKLAAAAPDSFTIVFTTTKGDVEVLVQRRLAPRGADRLHYLVTNGFFSGARFYRVLPGFVAQFGLSGIPAVDAAFDKLTLDDDPVRAKNLKGTLVFATAGPNTRTTQLFINLADNAQLDQMGFAPLGKVVRGMDAVEKFYAGYGEGAPMGAGPDQMKLKAVGNDYLKAQFPELDSVVRATIKP
ncbi:MAG: peptidylprolyl isomerase [Gemmatimonadetes bacterium]|nr:peptidylprolyl isomerase [Gemmatimonadota bacterium]